MTTILHIARKGEDGDLAAIGLDEWRRAVERVDGMRMAEGDAAAVNPVTAETVVMPNRGGDAEVWRADFDGWTRVFWWSPQGKISFRAPEFAGDPTLDHAHRLASDLGAAVYDDNGKPMLSGR